MYALKSAYYCDTIYVSIKEVSTLIKLLDVLQIPEGDYKRYKIHFATGSNDKRKPYNEFLINRFKDFQERQTLKNFSREYILSLIYYEKDIWMFGGIYEVLPDKPVPITEGEWTGWKYNTRLVDVQTDMIGRIFVYYKKDYRNSYPNLEMIPSNENVVAPRDMEISSIKEKPNSIKDFPGFDNVNINRETFETIFAQSIASWKNALSKVKGIYLIVDMKTGKQYVGKADGEEGIWQRWKTYYENGHGDDEKLIKLLKENGNEYRYNFKYSILEICSDNFGKDIDERETYWKEVLMTRGDYGLNCN